jgi:hypothetical protein
MSLVSRGSFVAEGLKQEPRTTVAAVRFIDTRSTTTHPVACILQIRCSLGRNRVACSRARNDPFSFEPSPFSRATSGSVATDDCWHG